MYLLDNTLPLTVKWSKNKYNIECHSMPKKNVSPFLKKMTGVYDTIICRHSLAQRHQG